MGAVTFNQALERWNVAHVKNMRGMVPAPIWTIACVAIELGHGMGHGVWYVGSSHLRVLSIRS